jgi:hypothetical protein
VTSTAVAAHAHAKRFRLSISIAGPAARFISSEGEVYLLPKERVPDAAVDKSSILSTLTQTSGATAELPFSSEVVKAWKDRACLSEADKAQLSPRSWPPVLTNLKVRSNLALLAAVSACAFAGQTSALPIARGSPVQEPVQDVTDGG